MTEVDSEPWDAIGGDVPKILRAESVTVAVTEREARDRRMQRHAGRVVQEGAAWNFVVGGVPASGPGTGIADARTGD